VYFEGSTIVLVAIEHIHRAFSIVFCGKDYSAESPRAAILAKSDVCAENGTCLTEKIFKILPLAMKW
jgi:hypothetical protein